MNDTVYSVIRESFFDLNNLDKIESQIGLLNNDRRSIFILRILQTGLKVSNFFFEKIGLCQIIGRLYQVTINA